MNVFTTFKTPKGPIIIIDNENINETKKNIKNYLKENGHGNMQISQTCDILNLNFKDLKPIFESDGVKFFKMTCHTKSFLSSFLNKDQSVKLIGKTIIGIDHYNHTLKTLRSSSCAGFMKEVYHGSEIHKLGIIDLCDEIEQHRKDTATIDEEKAIDCASIKNESPPVQVVIKHTAKSDYIHECSFSEKFRDSLFFKTCSYLVSTSDISLMNIGQQVSNGVIYLTRKTLSELSIHFCAEFAGQKYSNELMSLISTKLPLEKFDYHLLLSNGSNYIKVLKKESGKKSKSDKAEGMTKKFIRGDVSNEKKALIDDGDSASSQCDETNKPVFNKDLVKNQSTLHSVHDLQGIKRGNGLSTPDTNRTLMKDKDVKVETSVVSSSEIANLQKLAYGTTVSTPTSEVMIESSSFVQNKNFFHACHIPRTHEIKARKTETGLRRESSYIHLEAMSNDSESISTRWDKVMSMENIDQIVSDRVIDPDDLAELLYINENNAMCLNESAKGDMNALNHGMMLDLHVLSDSQHDLCESETVANENEDTNSSEDIAFYVENSFPKRIDCHLIKNADVTTLGEYLWSHGFGNKGEISLCKSSICYDFILDVLANERNVRGVNVTNDHLPVSAMLYGNLSECEKHLLRRSLTSHLRNIPW